MRGFPHNYDRSRSVGFPRADSGGTDNRAPAIHRAARRRIVGRPAFGSTAKPPAGALGLQPASNRWMVTSSRAPIVLLAQHAFICLVLIAAALGVLPWVVTDLCFRTRRGIGASVRRRTVLLLLAVEYFAILPPIFSLMQVPALAMQVWSVAVIVTIVAFVISLMRAGQGGARLVAISRSPIGDRTADARWIGGLLYFNRTDPALSSRSAWGSVGQ